MSRPVEWIQEKKDKACEIIFTEMTKGKSLRQILDKDDTLPSRRLFYEWIAKDQKLSNHYAQLAELRADIIFDEILEIADDTTNDSVYTESGKKANSEWIRRSRLRVDARKWILAKMNPKKFGDKTDITTNGKDIGQYRDWTDEQLENEIKRLTGK